MKQNERNTFNGREVRQEEHDLLPEMRQKDLQPQQEQVRVMRVRQERKDEKIQLAEESQVILIFYNFKNLFGISF